MKNLFNFIKTKIRHVHCNPHDYIEDYYDLRADYDDPGGPRTYHGICWKCSKCGKEIDGGSSKW